MKRLLSLFAAIVFLAVLTEGNQLNVYAVEETKQDFPKLQQTRGVHPRVYVDNEYIESLKIRIENEQLTKENFNKLIDSVDGMVKGTVTEYYKSSSDTSEEWMRPIADNLLNICFAYLLTGEQEYAEFAEKYVTTICNYPSWGPDNTPDLALGHMLHAVGVAYDWMFNTFSEDTKSLMRQKLLSKGQIMYNASIRTDGWFWTQEWLQNHMWITMTGMTGTALALYDEYPEMENWIAQAYNMMDTTMNVLGDDGYSHEGYGYWDYGVNWLFRYMDIARHNLGKDYYDTPWFVSTIDYAASMLLPRDAWTRSNRNVDFADDPRGEWGASIGPYRKIAREYEDTVAQYLAGEMTRRGFHTVTWLDLYWADNSIPEGILDEKQTFYHFKDMDVISSRSGWSGNESLVAFKSGPYVGHKAVEENNTNPIIDWGGGHVHPDVNHFVIFGNNDWLIRDDQYTPKHTFNHNTLLIDGRGQMGEGSMWFNSREPQGVKARPRIKRAVTKKDYDYFVGAGAPAYASDLDLKKFDRHIIYLKPDVMIVVDDIELNKQHDLELRFFPEQQVTHQLLDGAYIVVGQNSMLRYQSLSVDGGKAAAEKVPYVIDRSGALQDRLCFQNTKENAKSWQNINVFSWSDKGENPAVVSMEHDGDDIVFTSNGQTARLNVKASNVKVSGALRTNDDEIKVKVDNILINTDVAPVVKDGRTLVPFRAIFNAMGAEVDFDEDTNTVIGVKDGKTVKLKVGGNEASIDNKPYTLDFSVETYDGRVMVPVRFISEGLGYRVLWNENTKTVFVNSPMPDDAPYADSAALGGISVAGVPVPNFNPDVLEYEVEKIWQGTAPVVGMPNVMGAQVNVRDEYDNSAKIYVDVISPNGKNKATYTIKVAPFVGLGNVGITQITSSSSDPGNIIALMDGKPNTYFAAEGDGQWLEMDLGSVQTVSGVAVAFWVGHTRKAMFEVQLSADGKKYQTVLNGTSNGTTDKGEQFYFEPHQARFVRIIGHMNTSNAWNSYGLVGVLRSKDTLNDIILTSENNKVFVNDTVKLKLDGKTGTGEDADMSKIDVEYYVDNPKVANVDKNGVVTGIAPGTFVVTAVVRTEGIRYTRNISLTCDERGYTLTTIADASVLQWKSEENNNTVNIEVMASIDGGTEREGYFKFDLSEVEGTVVKAVFYAYANVPNSNVPTLNWQACGAEKDNWEEDTLSWSNKPKYGKTLSKVKVNSQMRWLEFGVTDFIRRQAEGDKIATVVIRGVETHDLYGSIKSKEDNDGKNAPYLKIVVE